jgi:CubicO group peptidase (beta-lactamase class C family)
LSFAWILGGLIEEVTGEPYEKFLEKHLIQPLGLANELHLGGLPDYVEMERLAVLTSRALKPLEKQTNNDSSVSNVTQTNEEKPSSQGRLAKFQGRQQLMNPSVFNMRKVRAAKLPSANGHASAYALATLMDAMISQRDNQYNRIDRGSLLPNTVLDAARSPQNACIGNNDSSVMLDNEKASFGLGFQVHNVRLPDGTTVQSLGHAGFGGSILLGIPEMKLSMALTTNQLSLRSETRSRLMQSIFQGLGIETPPSLIE